MTKPQITIGPIQFHWPAPQWRDFYARMADEAPVDIVYIGEVVCSKRAPFYEPLYEEVAERLTRAGKKVVFSTLAEVMIKHDRKMVNGMCALDDMMVEANDASALFHLSGRPHSIGPFMNVYSEDTMAFLASKGAMHFCLPPELPGDAIDILGKKARELDVSLEVQVYGRIPLALSARCYHARAHGRVKDNCQFVCEKDPDGMALKTVTGKSFLTINGIETMSHSCLNLVQELDDLREKGVSRFRLSPHSHNMVEVSRLFRAALDGTADTPDILAALAREWPDAPFSNGFYHKRKGYDWVAA